MTYILMIWTVVAMAGDRHQQAKAHDWRPIGEFHQLEGNISALDKCESAGRQLGIKSENYRCVRSR